MIIKRINNTKTIAAPDTPVLHISIPPFCLFTIFYGNFEDMWLVILKIVVFSLIFWYDITCTMEGENVWKK